MNSLGWRITKPKATFYLWAKIPKNNLSLDARGSSIIFAKRLLSKTGIVVTPGIGFGKSGEGYVRFALTVDGARIKEAIKRLSRW